VPTVEGIYTVSVKLLNEHVVGSPYELYVQPGEVAPGNCDTTVADSDLLEIEAGNTYRFTINLRDIYNNNLLTGAPSSVIKIVAIYEDHDEWPSPINIVDLHNWE
jgi:hypothetical protein